MKRSLIHRGLSTIVLIILISLPAVQSYEKPEIYQKNPDAYYQNVKNIGVCPECDNDYFNKPDNIKKNPEAHHIFFSTPGNALKAPQGAQAWLRQLKITATVDLSKADKSITLDTKTASVTNGKLSINPAEYPTGTKIKALPEGGFEISGTTVQGFSKVTYDKAKDTYTMDGAKVHLSPSSKEGQKVIAHRDASGTIDRIQLPAFSRYDFPTGGRSVLAEKETALLLDGSDPFKLDGAAISFSGDLIKANNKVRAHIQNGDLSVYAIEGRYVQKDFPGFVPGKTQLQLKDKSIITLSSEGNAESLRSSVAANPISYQDGKPFDSRKELVERAQHLLNVNGAHLREDGKYGPKTADAVRVFQESHGLAQTGVLDQQTLLLLNQETGVQILNQQERKIASIQKLKTAGYNDPAIRGAIKRPPLTHSATPDRLDTTATVPEGSLTNYFEKLSKQSSIYPNLKKEGRDQQKKLMQSIPSLIYQAAQEAEKKYGIPIDPAKLVALAAHETGNFGSYNARKRNNFGGIKNGQMGYREFSTPEEGAQAFVEHMYTSSHYFKKGKFSMEQVSRTWCPLSDTPCAGHLDSWKGIYQRYRNLG